MNDIDLEPGEMHQSYFARFDVGQNVKTLQVLATYPVPWVSVLPGNLLLLKRPDLDYWKYYSLVDPYTPSAREPPGQPGTTVVP